LDCAEPRVDANKRRGPNKVDEARDRPREMVFGGGCEVEKWGSKLFNFSGRAGRKRSRSRRKLVRPRHVQVRILDERCRKKGGMQIEPLRCQHLGSPRWQVGLWVGGESHKKRECGLRIVDGDPVGREGCITCR
jgi:hypothetical protein